MQVSWNGDSSTTGNLLQIEICPKVRQNSENLKPEFEIFFGQKICQIEVTFLKFKSFQFDEQNFKTYDAIHNYAWTWSWSLLSIECDRHGLWNDMVVNKDDRNADLKADLESRCVLGGTCIVPGKYHVEGNRKTQNWIAFSHLNILYFTALFEAFWRQFFHSEQQQFNGFDGLRSLDNSDCESHKK